MMAVVVALLACDLAGIVHAEHPFQPPGPPEQRSHIAGYDSDALPSLGLFVVQMRKIGARGTGQIAGLVELSVEEFAVLLESLHGVFLEAPSLVGR